MSIFKEAPVWALGVLVIWLHICEGQVAGELYVNSSCQMKSNKPGICTKLTECKSIDDALRKRKYKFTDLVICTFEGEEEVICCPDKVGTVTTTNPNIFVLNPATTPAVSGSRVAARKSEKVCEQYQKAYLALSKVLDFHILDGLPAALGEFPHMAALGYPSEQGGESVIVYNCGGSLISDRYVLTAAHCVNRPESLPTLIRLGTVDLAEESGDLMNVGVEGVLLFPEYKTSRQYHDIALVRLNSTLTFTSRLIFPACLDTDRRDIQPNQSVIATGWGSTNVTTRAKSSILLQVTLSTVELNDCNERHKNNEFNRRLPDGLNDGQMCAYDPNLKKDTCEGDSGGPLQVKLVNISKIIGITSFGISCGSSIPSVYARVAYYLDWLEKIVWPDIAV